jgi:hypothetical protein
MWGSWRRPARFANRDYGDHGGAVRSLSFRAPARKRVHESTAYDLRLRSGCVPSTQ